MRDKVRQAAIEAILNVARWAPSGDNAQPWTFRFAGDRELVLSVRRTNPNVYEYRLGQPTLISAGALLENIEIAAPAFGLTSRWVYLESSGGVDRIAVNFDDGEVVSQPELFQQIYERSVDRRPFHAKPLSGEQKRRLSGALGPDLNVQWYESTLERLRIAKLSALATKIRLAIPETFQVHRDIVDWDHRESDHAIPSVALGLDRVTLKLTRWSMASKRRAELMNVLGAPTFAALQMDLLPGLLSAGYFVIRLRNPSDGVDLTPTQTLRAGQAIQRYWLMATKLGLAVQPCVAILAFWTYGVAGIDFTTLRRAQRQARLLASRAGVLLGPSEKVLFLGRIGSPRGKAPGRSVRVPLSRILLN